MHPSLEINKNSNSKQRNFAPYVANSLEVEGGDGFYFYSVFYHEKQNLIIAYSADDSIQFYDATTLLPAEGFERQKLANQVTEMSFCPETETFLLGFANGEICSFNLSNKTLKKLEEPVKRLLLGIIFINSLHYAFSQYKDRQLFVGNLENGQLLGFPLGRNLHDMKSLPKRNLLFSSLTDGSVMMHRTDRLPKLPVLDSTLRDYPGVRRFQKMEMQINQKDYILTTVNDSIIEILHLTKGRMRRLKVIQMPDEVEVYSVASLEKQKMIVTTHNTSEINFWRFPSGKLEYTLDVGMDRCFSIFLMKDKNALGVVGSEQNTIKIVQLYPQ